MKKSKLLILSLCAVSIIAASTIGTLAYLTSQATVTNTFTVGQVKLTLDEAKVNSDGTPVNPAERVTSNSYHLIPGMSYTKDPTVTIQKGSEEAYVRMLVTIDHYSELTAIFGSSFLPQNYVTGWDSTTWVCTDITHDTAGNSATYEFRYYDIASDKDTAKPTDTDDLVLDALFDEITIPSAITGEQLATINDLKITIVAHAIQATGFTDADTAWTAFDDQATATN